MFLSQCSLRSLRIWLMLRIVNLFYANWVNSVLTIKFVWANFVEEFSCNNRFLSSKKVLRLPPPPYTYRGGTRNSSCLHVDISGCVFAEGLDIFLPEVAPPIPPFTLVSSSAELDTRPMLVITMSNINVLKSLTITTVNKPISKLYAISIWIANSTVKGTTAFSLVSLGLENSTISAVNSKFTADVTGLYLKGCDLTNTTFIAFNCSVSAGNAGYAYGIYFEAVTLTNSQFELHQTQLSAQGSGSGNLVRCWHLLSSSLTRSAVGVYNSSLTLGSQLALNTYGVSFSSSGIVRSRFEFFDCPLSFTRESVSGVIPTYGFFMDLDVVFQQNSIFGIHRCIFTVSSATDVGGFHILGLFTQSIFGIYQSQISVTATSNGRAVLWYFGQNPWRDTLIIFHASSVYLFGSFSKMFLGDGYGTNDASNALHWTGGSTNRLDGATIPIVCCFACGSGGDCPKMNKYVSVSPPPAVANAGAFPIAPPMAMGTRLASLSLRSHKQCIVVTATAELLPTLSRSLTSSHTSTPATASLSPVTEWSSGTASATNQFSTSSTVGPSRSPNASSASWSAATTISTDRSVSAPTPTFSSSVGTRSRASSPSQSPEGQTVTHTACQSESSTRTATLPFPHYPPIPVNEDLLVASRRIADTAGAFGIVAANVGGRLGVGNALARFTVCGGGDDADESEEASEDSLPVIMHPLQFSVGEEGSVEGLYGAAVLGNTLLIPIVFSAIVRGPIVWLLRRLRGGNRLEGTEELFAVAGWPFVAATPFVTLAEGIGVSVVRSLRASSPSIDGNIHIIVFGAVGLATLAALTVIWLRVLWVVIPRHKIRLAAADLKQRRSLVERALDPLRIWVPTSKDSEAAEPCDDNNNNTKKSLRMPGGAGQRQTPSAVAPAEADGAEAADGLAVELLPFVTGDNAPNEFRERAGRSATELLLEMYGGALGGKWLFCTEIASFACSLIVGVAEGLPATSFTLCRARVLIALFAATAQCVLSCFTFSPLEFILQALLGLLVVPLAVVAVVDVFAEGGGGNGVEGERGELLLGLTLTANLIGMLAMAVGFVSSARDVFISGRRLNRRPPPIAEQQRHHISISADVEGIALASLDLDEHLSVGIHDGSASASGVALLSSAPDVVADVSNAAENVSSRPPSPLAMVNGDDDHQSSVNNDSTHAEADDKAAIDRILAFLDAEDVRRSASSQKESLFSTISSF